MSLQPYYGNHLLPGAGSRFETVENVIHWGPAHLQQWMGAPRISSTARDTGNTDYTTTLRSGLALGRVTDSGSAEVGMLIEWDPAATDGSQFLFGFLEKTLQLQDPSGSATDRYTGRVMIGGNVRGDRIVLPGNTTPGLTGANAYALTAQMNHRFLLDNNLPGNNLMNGAIITKTDDYTVTEADNGADFDNLGATGTVVFTLPDTPKLGLKYKFSDVAGETVTVDSNSSNIVNGGAAASSFNVPGSTGVVVEGRGSIWFVR